MPAISSPRAIPRRPRTSILGASGTSLRAVSCRTVRATAPANPPARASIQRWGFAIGFVLGGSVHVPGDPGPDRGRRQVDAEPGFGDDRRATGQESGDFGMVDRVPEPARRVDPP